MDNFNKVISRYIKPLRYMDHAQYKRILLIERIEKIIYKSTATFKGLSSAFAESTYSFKGFLKALELLKIKGETNEIR